MATVASTEPDPIRRYFDQRGWSSDETRSHAEVVETFTPRYGWQRNASRRKISHDWLLVAQAEGITRVTLRVRYSDRRPVTADFSVTELLREDTT